MLVGGDPQIARRPLVAVLDAGHRDHLRADETGPEAATLAPKGLDADAGHRGQNEPARDLDAPERPALCQVDVHGV